MATNDAPAVEPARRSRAVFLATVLALCAAALVVVLFVNAHFVRAETKPPRSEVGRLVALPGGTLQVRVDGPQDAPTIVLIHRFASSLREWDPVMPMLALRHRVVRIDLLGHGGSAKPRSGYSIENEALLVAEALRAIHVEHATVVGHSMGGAVAVALATADPGAVGRLVLMDSNDRTRYFDLPLLSRWAPRAVVGPALWTLATDSMIRSGLSVLYAPGFSVPDRDVRDVRRMTYSSYTAALAGFLDYLNERGLDSRLAALHLPRLVIWGAHDRLVRDGALELYRRVPGVQVVVMPHSGHSPLVEEPRGTARVLLHFAGP